jgi:hypothetical protein
MKHKPAARYLSKMTLYSFFAVLFFFIFWFVIKRDDSLYSYYYTVLAVIFHSSLVCAALSLLTVLFSLFDMVTEKQLSSVRTLLLSLFSAVCAAAAGLYAGILQTVY